MTHLTAISFRIAYLIAASIITYALFNSFAWHGRASWVLIGIGFMLPALLLQVLAQEAPFIIIILTNIKWITAGAAPIIDLVMSIVKLRIYAMAIYMGFMAGVFQEVFKYLAVKGREPRSALYIGYGFALIDIAFTTINLIAPLIVPALISAHYQYAAIVPIISLVGLAIQPIASFLFHPGSSMMLKAYQMANRGLRGLLLMILAHAYLDSFTWYMNNAIALGLIYTPLIIPLSTIYFTTIAALSIAIFTIGLRDIEGKRNI